MTEFPLEQIVERLNWRYAVKRFDSSRKISATNWQALQTAIHLSPSSFGLQPWRFVVVTDPQLKAKLSEASWGQTQPQDCSHLVALAAKKEVDAIHVDRFIVKTADDRKLDAEALSGYRQVIMQFIEAMAPHEIEAWSARQVYIALGQLMAAAAMAGIDTCPMEGIDKARYDELLGLAGSEYWTIVACAVGYRDESDSSAIAKKTRFAESELFIHL